MRHLSLVISILALIVAGTTGGYAAWTNFTDTVVITKTGPQLLTQWAGDPCLSFGVWSGVLRFGSGQYGEDGTCDWTFDLGVGRYADASGEIGLEIQRSAYGPGTGPVGISLNSENDAVPAGIGIKIIDGDLWITDNKVGARYLLGKVTKDGAYEFANGCRISPDGAALQSSCKIRQPLR